MSLGARGRQSVLNIAAIRMFFRERIDLLRLEIAEQKAQTFLWAPVFVAFGIAGYFALPSEPPLLLGIIPFVTIITMAVLQNPHSTFRYPLLMTLLISLGFLAAQARTLSIHTPMLTRDTGPVMVEGNVLSLETLGKGEGARIVLRDLVIEDLSAADTPRKIRLKLRKDQDVLPGQRISVLSHLHPPSGPVIPGGFDFRRYMYFQGIGAVGFTYRAPEVIGSSKSHGFFQTIENMRTRIAKGVEAAAPKQSAGVVIALLTGQKQAIAEEDQEAMRHAGLAHILAISGLHIGLFSGVVFFVFRLMLVSIPGFAVRHPVKKYAAVLAFLAALMYMFLAGASVSAQRAMLMTGVAFFAIVLDRSAISLRLVAFAALVVLLIMPESLFAAGFQMSFGAVAALIVFYDATRNYWANMYANAGLVKRMAFYFIGVIVTTMIASIATAPFGLFHFQYTALYSVLGNVLVMPLVGFIIMPLAVLVLVTIPLGVEHWPVKLMGQGVENVLEVAHWVSALPHAILHVQAWPLLALALIVVGLTFMILWRGPLRVLGLLPIMLASIFVGQNRMPDILVSNAFDVVSVYAPPDLLVSARNKDRFSIENWERSYGLEEAAAKRWPSEGRVSQDMICGEFGCRIQKYGQKISIVKAHGQIKEECSWANVILSFEPVPPHMCKPDKAKIIDKWDAYNSGSHALWINENGVELKTALEIVGQRPWSKKSR